MFSDGLRFDFSSVNTNYCEFIVILSNDTDNPNQHYHDTQYGLPIEDGNELSEWPVLEIDWAGLSWMLMPEKRRTFQTVFRGFDVNTVATFDEADTGRLLANAGITRNRLKTNAAIYSVRQIKQIQQEYGSFRSWLDAHHPLDKTERVKLFKRYLKLVDGEIVGGLLISTGCLPGTHVESCPVYGEMLACRPKWVEAV